ncbi:MAG: hypothetical protein J4F28_02160 [Nitrosopumilaceae archaeon]|nr:hypothetical protein [Nitrosopumilaceae archaeon]
MMQVGAFAIRRATRQLLKQVSLVRRSPTKRAVKHLQSITKNDEWGTPIDILRNGCREFHINPKLDVAASRYLHIPYCTKYYTIDDDALTRPWDMDWWCNPPYTRVRDFVGYGIKQVEMHGVRGLFLTYAKVDTRWWHDLIEPHCRYKFIRGRVRFLTPYGQQRGPAPYPSVYIYVGPETVQGGA